MGGKTTQAAFIDLLHFPPLFQLDPQSGYPEKLQRAIGVTGDEVLPQANSILRLVGLFRSKCCLVGSIDGISPPSKLRVTTGFFLLQDYCLVEQISLQIARRCS